MKQQVNLYQPALVIKRQYLTLPRLLWSWLAMMAILLAAVTVIKQQHNQLSAALTEQRQTLDNQLQEAGIFQQALQQRQPSQTLQLQHKQLQDNIKQKQHLLSYLAGQQRQAGQLYSPVLQHLQQIDSEPLWLTTFSLKQQQSSFEGMTMQPEAVPLWLEQLRSLGYFSGQKFGVIDLKQVPQQQAVTFRLSAQPGEQP